VFFIKYFNKKMVMTQQNTPFLGVTDDTNADLSVASSISIIPSEPFRNIALMFSGGGFRAASFSLGALSYLYRAEYKEKALIENVKFTTSTSGGSITNAFYAVRLYENKVFSFQQVYSDLRDRLDGERLLKTVFEILKDDSKWNEAGILKDDQGKQIKIKKKRNLINAFAKAYSEQLYGNATLATLADCAVTPHLHEVCFNTTEFNNGMNFYFQVNGFSHEVMPRGNSYLKFRDFEIARKIKVADIVAASSCFPSGFEPILFPNDFVHKDCTNVNDMLNAVSYGHNNPLDLADVINKPFALMDGGITDNMGIHSVMINDSARKAGNKFDLILSCDVTSYFNDSLGQVEPAGKSLLSGITLQSVINCFKFSMLIFIACIIGIIYGKAKIASYLFLIPSLSLSAIYVFSRWKLSSLKKKSSGTATIAFKYLGHFLKLPFSSLLPMLQERLNSSLKLVTDLFLKQIRRGQYEHLFTQPVIKDRAISCLIYEFSSAHENRRLNNLTTRDALWWNSMSHQLMPGKNIQQMVDEAKSMGTTLWFAEGEKELKDKIIATGQLTTCYSLVKHICRMEVLEAYKNSHELQTLKAALLKDWAMFQKNPFFMIDDLNKNK
jgi:predicted acylesterase/phospholipase RssA